MLVGSLVVGVGCVVARHKRRVRFRLLLIYGLSGLVPLVFFGAATTVLVYLLFAAGQSSRAQLAVEEELRALGQLAEAFSGAAVLPEVSGVSLRYVPADSSAGLEPVRFLSSMSPAPAPKARLALNPEHLWVGIRFPPREGRALEVSVPLLDGLFARVERSTGYRLSLFPVWKTVFGNDRSSEFEFAYTSQGLEMRARSSDEVVGTVRVRLEKLPILGFFKLPWLEVSDGPARSLVGQLPVVVEDTGVEVLARLSDWLGVRSTTVLGFLGISFGGIQVVLLGIAWGLGAQLVRSADRLEGAAREVVRGNFATRVPVRGNDQLGAVARTFNRMVVELEESRDELAKSHRIEGEIAACARIQGGLLPALSCRFDGFELAAYFRPARAVGGDLFDYFELPGGRVGVLVADVAGKGVAAALYAAELKGLIMALADGQRSPLRVVEGLDRALRRTLQPGSFVSLIYAEMDSATGRTRLVRAGHPPGLWVGAGGTREVHAEGLALGLPRPTDSRPIFDMVEFDLSNGELLVLYTDGLGEATDGMGRELAQGRIQAAATEAFRANSGDAQAMLDALVATVETHGRVSDDITILVVARSAQGKNA